MVGVPFLDGLYRLQIQLEESTAMLENQGWESIKRFGKAEMLGTGGIML